MSKPGVTLAGWAPPATPALIIPAQAPVPGIVHGRWGFEPGSSSLCSKAPYHRAISPASPETALCIKAVEPQIPTSASKPTLERGKAESSIRYSKEDKDPG